MVDLGLKLYRNLSNRLVTCSGIVKRRSYRYCLHYNPGLMQFFDVLSIYWTAFHVPLRYIERYFTYSIVYQKASCEWLCIRNTTTDLSSHVPCIYRETPLGYLIHLRKSLWPSCLEPYTKNNIHGDYYTRTLKVYHKWNLPDNPSERPDYLNSSYHFKCACLTYTLCREICFGVFSSFSDPRLDRNYTNWLS